MFIGCYCVAVRVLVKEGEEEGHLLEPSDPCSRLSLAEGNNELRVSSTRALSL